MKTDRNTALTIEHVSPIDHDNHDERRELIQALGSTPKEIPPKYLYDGLGSELFEGLTDLPEYYPTRAETEILERHADGVMAEFRPEELVEIGSGSSRKTRLLLEAMHRVGGDRYVPLDISEDAVREAADALCDDYDWLSVHGVIADFHADLSNMAHERRRLVAFLGGTIGNLYADERASLLARLRSLLRPGDAFLLGFDLIKDSAVLEAAYDDSQGRTRGFIENLLTVMNRDYGADFDASAFAYRAHWDADNHWVEMQLVSRREQRVRVDGLDLDLEFAAGEHLRAEVSTKFTPEMISEHLTEAGFETVSVLFDEARRYGLAVAVPTL